MKQFLLTLIACATLGAEILPLQDGNIWIYREAKSGEEFTVRVGTPYYVGGQVYYSLLGYVPQRLLVRYNEAGSLVYLNEEKEREENLTSFEVQRGAWWNAPFRPCEQEGQRQEKDVVFNGGAGRFEKVVEIRYRSFGCADMGVESEQFVENIGMLRRTHTTFAGPRNYDLVYALIGKSEINAQPNGGLNVSASNAPGKDKLEVTLRYASNTFAPLSLRFPTAQEWEIQLRDTTGQVVYRWSDGQLFDQVEHINNIVGRWWQRLEIPKPAAGRYTLEAWLTTVEGTPRISSAIVIELP